MKLLRVLLNLPWSTIGLFGTILSLPTKISFDKTRPAIISQTKSFWWCEWAAWKKGSRAMTAGNVVILGKTLDKDLEHELIHVDQHMREPFIHPILYLIESIRNGYKNNKYEVEAYARAGNKYVS